MEFKKGDHIIVDGEFEGNTFRNKKGVIVENRSSNTGNYAVNFGRKGGRRNFEFHSLGGRLKSETGWFVDSDLISMDYSYYEFDIGL